MAKTLKPDQQKRFEEAAREAGADESGAAFEQAFAAIVPPKRRPATPTQQKQPRKKSTAK
jgi:hypothetical protein